MSLYTTDIFNVFQFSEAFAYMLLIEAISISIKKFQTILISADKIQVIFLLIRDFIIFKYEQIS